MELIKRTKSRKIYGTTRKFGLFKCPKCGRTLEKEIHAATKAKGCSIKCSKEEHGDSPGLKKKARLYSTWSNMKKRCNNANTKGYKNYGGKGIKVCKEWEEYPPFKKWALENGYNSDLTIDRIDDSLGYNPDNCQFIPMGYNSVKRSTVFLTYADAEKIRALYRKENTTHRKLADVFGISQRHTSDIINYKRWSVDHENSF